MLEYRRKAVIVDLQGLLTGARRQGAARSGARRSGRRGTARSWSRGGQTSHQVLVIRRRSEVRLDRHRVNAAAGLPNHTLEDIGNVLTEQVIDVDILKVVKKLGFTQHLNVAIAHLHIYECTVVLRRSNGSLISLSSLCTWFGNS